MSDRLEIEYGGNKYWYDKKQYDLMTEYYAKKEKELFDYMFYGIKPKEEEVDKESFYYVKLKNSKNEGTLGMKSRITGNIFLTKGYEVDLTKPLEDSDFKYVRDASSFDL